MLSQAKGLLAMQDMFQTTVENVLDVLVVQVIINMAAVFAGAHQSHLSQMAQVVGDGRLAKPYVLGQLANVHFGGREQGDDPDPARVAQGAEKLGNLSRKQFIQLCS